jgi:hypothetical protein
MAVRPSAWIRPTSWRAASISPCSKRAELRPPAETADRRQLLDQSFQVAPDEGLAARDPDLLDAVGDEGARESVDLLEAEELTPLEELVVASEDLLRHAVDAAEVAAAGDRDAQVAERPAECVGCSHECRLPR